MIELMHQWIFYLLTKYEDDILVQGQKLPIGALYGPLYDEVNSPIMVPPIHKKVEHNLNTIILPYHPLHVEEMAGYSSNLIKYWYNSGYFQKQRGILDNLWKMDSSCGVGQKSAHQHTHSKQTFGYLFVFALSVQNRPKKIQVIHEYLHSADIPFLTSLSHS